jgi:Phosphotransferase enzyme family
MDTGRTEARALEAARAIAADHGVCCDQATVVHSGSNVVVHLRPGPVVARVMSGTAVLHDDPERWLSREVAVLEFLAPSGLAVRPSSLMPHGPYHRGGLWLTFCEWLGEHTRAQLASGPDRLGRSLRELHDALRAFPGELGDLLDVRHDIERLHRELRPADGLDPGAIAALLDRLLALTGSVFAAPLPAQALHGDVSLGNLLVVDDRLVWNDFEDTFRGPLQWDLAGFVDALRARGADSAFVSRALAAYGWTDEQELAPFIEAHAVYGEIWRLYAAQRRTSSGVWGSQAS